METFFSLSPCPACSNIQVSIGSLICSTTWKKRDSEDETNKSTENDNDADREPQRVRLALQPSTALVLVVRPGLYNHLAIERFPCESYQAVPAISGIPTRYFLRTWDIRRVLSSLWWFRWLTSSICYSGKNDIGGDFHAPSNVNTFTLDWQLTATGMRLVEAAEHQLPHIMLMTMCTRLVTCAACGLSGSVLEPAGIHSCKLPDGTWGPADNVIQKGGYYVIINIKSSLLSHYTFRPLDHLATFASYSVVG